MTAGEALYYTTTEIRTYLPTGWHLAPGETAGRWNPEKRTWTVRVMDGSDLEWAVTVEPAAAQSMGRLEALRDRLGSVRLGGARRARQFLG